MRETHRVDTNRLRLVLDGGAGVAARARALVASEAQCCGFFRFAVTAEGDGVTIDVRVPASRTDVLDGLQQQATAVPRPAPTRPA